MGHGGYSSRSRALRATATGLYCKSASEIFSRNFNSSMNPNGVDRRESRDSEEHPNSVPVIIALDVTGSMGQIPHHLVKEGLPKIVQAIIDKGIAHPQVLFIGIGDHECDQAPLQIGQFESSDELMDKWLTDLYIEGGGGANKGESYLLAWYFAARYTSTDHWDKRGKKGILFTIGDEPCLTKLSKGAQKSIMGAGQYEDTNSEALLKEAQEKWEVFHIHVLQGHNGNNPQVKEGWDKLIGDHVIHVQDKTQIADVIANNVVELCKEQVHIVDPTLDRFDAME